MEISTVFLLPDGDSNFMSDGLKSIDEATTWNTNIRYRLKRMFDGWVYYTDVYRRRVGLDRYYNAVSEEKAKTYLPARNEKLVQKADAEIYKKVCDLVNEQMKNAFRWWDAFEKNQKSRMKFL